MDRDESRMHAQRCYSLGVSSAVEIGHQLVLRLTADSSALDELALNRLHRRWAWQCQKFDAFHFKQRQFGLCNEVRNPAESVK